MVIFFFKNVGNFQCSLFVQATHRNGTVLSFYSMPEYEYWKESLSGNASGWSIKYYKVCSLDMEERNLGIHGYIRVLSVFYYHCHSILE
jgi:hypothetical protein